MAIHSSILAWNIPWMEEHDRQWSMGSQRVGHIWLTDNNMMLAFKPILVIKSSYDLCNHGDPIIEIKCVSHSVMSNSVWPPWTVALQAPLSMGYSRQQYWSGLPFSSLGGSSRSMDQTWVSCITGGFFTIWATREALASLNLTILDTSYHKSQDIETPYHPPMMNRQKQWGIYKQWNITQP